MQFLPVHILLHDSTWAYLQKVAIKLYSSHDESRHEVIWTRHDWLAMEQDTRIIQFQDIRLAAKLWGVIDVYSVLDERFVTAWITWFAGIDRYLEEGAASAAQGFQRDREDCAPYTLEMVSQFLRDHCTHAVCFLPFKTFKQGCSVDSRQFATGGLNIRPLAGPGGR